MFCPNCKSEYRPGYTECAGCHVALVECLPENIVTFNKHCPQCESKYPSDAEVCTNCHVFLISKSPGENDPACMVCPQCRAEYQLGQKECSDCLVALQDDTLAQEKAIKESEEPIEGDLVEVAVSRSFLQAQMVKSILEGYGNIRCLLENEASVAGISPYSSGGIRVFVRKENAEEARRIIADIEQGPLTDG